MYREIFVFASVFFFGVATSLGGWRAERSLLCLSCHRHDDSSGRADRGHGRGLAGGYAPAQRPGHEGALAHAWSRVSGALARFASAPERKNNYGTACQNYL